jgi:hypothetical protein
MGFDDLDEAMSQQDEDDHGDETAPQPTETTDETHADTTSEADQPAADDTADDSALDHPAFPFDDSTQEAIYPTTDTLTAFDDTLDFEVKRRLRDEGLRDVPKREYHEALLQLAIEQPDRLAELIIENRR